MNISIKNQILARIYGKGRDWTFSANDFTKDFKRWEIDRSLTSLAKEGKIRRVMQGIYDYPHYSKILKDFAPADIDKIAHTLARKFSWYIHPDGNTALNYLGLSTQVAGKSIYLSDGPNRKYKINGRELEFKHASMKEIKLEYDNSSLVVQALRAWGEGNITKDFIQKLSEKYTLKEWQNIKKDTAKTTGWIYKYISDIVSYAEGK
jgi:hypothetical protein